MSRSIGTLSEELAWVRSSTPWATSRSPIGGSPTRPLTISSRRSVSLRLPGRKQYTPSPHRRTRLMEGSTYALIKSRST